MTIHDTARATYADLDLALAIVLHADRAAERTARAALTSFRESDETRSYEAASHNLRLSAHAVACHQIASGVTGNEWRG